MLDIMAISQIVLLPTISKIESLPKDSKWTGLLPCDGRELSVEQYGTLFYIIGKTYGHRWDTTNDKPSQWYNLPKLDSPLEGYTYYICVRGLFPQRE